MIQEATLESFWLNDLNALFRDCLAIPYAAEIEGPHAHTLGAYERVCGSNGTTFMSRQKIADFAGLPLKTFEKHLDRNLENGWLINKGKRGRRTSTIALSEKFKVAIRNGKRLHPRIKDENLTWPMRSVFAYFANQFSAQAANRVEDHDYLTPITRRYATISSNTGLSRQTVKKAVNELELYGYLDMEFVGYGCIGVLIGEIEVKRQKTPWGNPVVARDRILMASQQELRAIGARSARRTQIQNGRGMTLENLGPNLDDCGGEVEGNGASTEQLLSKSLSKNHCVEDYSEALADATLGDDSCDEDLFAWNFDRLNFE